MSNVVRFSCAADVFAKADVLFRKVEADLRACLPDADIHHVGSTAIPGSLTKGDLDVLVRVHRESFERAEDVLAGMYDRNTESSRTSGFSAFMDISTDPELGIQLVVIDGAEDTFLVWRQKLRSDTLLRQEYDDLKRAYEAKPMDDYRKAKARFITRHLNGG